MCVPRDVENFGDRHIDFIAHRFFYYGGAEFLLVWVRGVISLCLFCLMCVLQGREMHWEGEHGMVFSFQFFIRVGFCIYDHFSDY